MTLTASDVLDQHTRLTDRLRHPDDRMCSFLRFHMGEHTRWNGSTAYSMFYPILRPDEPPNLKHAGQLGRTIAGGLARSLTYLVTEQMTADMRAIFEANLTGPALIHQEELPSKAGFTWLGSPWQIGDEEDFSIRALSWEFTEVLTDGTSLWPCIRACLWRWDDDITDDQEHGGSGGLGPLVMTHIAVIPLDLELYKPSGRDLARTDSFLSLLHLLWMFLGMEITANERAQVDRPARRRAQRLLANPEVRIITLRRVRYATDTEGTHRDVDWQCRWIVQGHYRHVERPEHPHTAIAAGTDKHCATCGGQLRAWIRPYVKGPDGLPLKVTDQTVYKLAR
jgi:hypothetical protein